jgi:hypothetical protein
VSIRRLVDTMIVSNEPALADQRFGRPGGLRRRDTDQQWVFTPFPVPGDTSNFKTDACA